MRKLLLLLSILITSSFTFYIQAEVLRDYVYPGDVTGINVSIFADEDLNGEPLVIHTDFGFRQERLINLTKGHVYSFTQEFLVPSDVLPGVYNITIFGRFYKRALPLHVVEKPLNITLTRRDGTIEFSVSTKKEVRSIHILFSCENGMVVSLNQSILKSGESLSRTVKCSAGTLTIAYEYFGKRKEEMVVEKARPFLWYYLVLGTILLFVIWKFFRR